MENFGSELAKALAAAFAVLPGFMARASASYFIPPHSRDKWNAFLFAATGTAFFWFLVLVGYWGTVGDLLDPEKWGRGEALLVALAWTIVFSVDLGARKFGPVLGKSLVERGAKWAVPTGVREPWLIAMDWIHEKNTVEAWMKSGTIYIGQVFVYPEMPEHDGIILKVYAVSMRDPDEPHRAVGYFEYPDDDPRQFVVLRRDDIEALKIKDWNSKLKTEYSDEELASMKVAYTEPLAKS